MSRADHATYPPKIQLRSGHDQIADSIHFFHCLSYPLPILGPLLVRPQSVQSSFLAQIPTTISPSFLLGMK